MRWERLAMGLALTAAAFIDGIEHLVRRIGVSWIEWDARLGVRTRPA